MEMTETDIEVTGSDRLRKAKGKEAGYSVEKERGDETLSHPEDA